MAIIVRLPLRFVTVCAFASFVTTNFYNFYHENNQLLLLSDGPQFLNRVEEEPSSTTTSGVNGNNYFVEEEQQQLEIVPRLIIAGAQKGGTTALAGILEKQENFLMNTKSYCAGEAHYFDWYLHNDFQNKPLPGLTSKEWQEFLQNEQDRLTNKVLQALRREYRAHWNLTGVDLKDVITFEKTPMYMIYPGTPALIKKVVPWAKILLILRDPGSRAFSHYKMANSRPATSSTSMPESFEYYIKAEVASLQEQGVSTAPSLEEFSKPRFDAKEAAFQLPHEITKRRLRRDKDSKYDMLYRGMYAELLAGWMEHFVLGENLLVISHEYFNDDNHLEIINQIQRFVGTKETQIHEDVLTYTYRTNNDNKINISETAKDYLKHFFKPYNDELANLMGEEWFNKYAGDRWTT